MGKFFQMQCLVSGLPAVPHDLRYWINLRRAFSNIYSARSGTTPAPTHDWKNLQGMLTALQMTFEGREHCGKDDARNIARIVIRMLQDGCDLRVNERLLRRDRADKALQKRNEEQQRRNMQNGQEKRALLPEKEKSEEDKERAVWREHLPYKVISVSKQEFLMELYEECGTCSESSDDEDG